MENGPLSFTCWSHSLSHLSSGIMHSRLSLFLHSKEIWFNFFFSNMKLDVQNVYRQPLMLLYLFIAVIKQKNTKSTSFWIIKYIKYMKDKQSSSKIKGQRFIICFCHFVFRVTCQEIVHIFWESLTCVSSVITFSLLIWRFIFSWTSSRAMKNHKIIKGEWW